MIIDVLTLFPEMFESLNHSIIKRAQDDGIITINVNGSSYEATIADGSASFNVFVAASISSTNKYLLSPGILYKYCVGWSNVAITYFLIFFSIYFLSFMIILLYIYINLVNSKLTKLTFNLIRDCTIFDKVGNFLLLKKS